MFHALLKDYLRSFSLLHSLIIPFGLTHETQRCCQRILITAMDKRRKEGKAASYNTDNIVLHSLGPPSATVSPTRFTEARPETTTGTTDTRDTSKSKAGSACMYNGGENAHRLEKVRRAVRAQIPVPVGPSMILERLYLD